MTKLRKAFTLIELIIVLVVIGLLAGFAVPSYLGARTRAMQREGRAILILMQAAEKVRDLETGSAGAFPQCANTAACNVALNLDIPAGGSYAYSVTNVAVGPPAQFCADATATAAGAVTQHICTDSDVLPNACAGAC